MAALPDARRAAFERVIAGELPTGWREVLRDYKQRALDAEPLASGIFVSAEINDALADLMPERMVGCADLEAPTSHTRLPRQSVMGGWSAMLTPCEKTAAPRPAECRTCAWWRG